uniref:Uncharacterized protein n=1 Tax=Setaria viridis TaxID=4556 RepID=A0A4V6D7S3_SETVI|nr:hypothetical protein SEVIR_4G019501v2 [Setaria viridis]
MDLKSKFGIRQTSASFSGETVDFRRKPTPPRSSSLRDLCHGVVDYVNPISALSSSSAPASSSPTPASFSLWRSSLALLARIIQTARPMTLEDLLNRLGFATKLSSPSKL